MVELQSTAARVILPVHARPGARENGITGIHAGRLKVSVTQAPDTNDPDICLTAPSGNRNERVILGAATTPTFVVC